MIDEEAGVSSSVAAHPSNAAGVYQIEVTFRTDGYSGAFVLAGSSWRIGFANTAAGAVGVSFVVDGGDTTTAWLDAPPVIGSTPVGVPAVLNAPIRNLGTAPLLVSVDADRSDGSFTLQRGSVAAPPGSTAPQR